MKKIIGTHFAIHCKGQVAYYSGKGFGYRQCEKCGASPDPMIREEVSETSLRKLEEIENQ